MDRLRFPTKQQAQEAADVLREQGYAGAHMLYRPRIMGNQMVPGYVVETAQGTFLCDDGKVRSEWTTISS
jgi:hypothetical protein